MIWLSLLSGGLRLARLLTQIVRERRLLRAGAAAAVSRRLAETHKLVRRALDARRAVRHDRNSVLNDRDRRD